MEKKIIHDIEKRRFITTIDTHVAELIYERDELQRTLSFTHTFVPKALEGQGVGRALVQEAITYMRSEGYTMVPVCPFVIAYAKKNIKTLEDILPQDFER